MPSLTTGQTVWGTCTGTYQLKRKAGKTTLILPQMSRVQKKEEQELLKITGG